MYEQDNKCTGKNGNVGMQLPIILSQLGLKNVECRVSDKVNFLDPNMDQPSRDKLYRALIEEGLGAMPGDMHETMNNLMARGLTNEESRQQYEAEVLFSKEFGIDSWLTYAPNMKITFGTVN